MGFLCSGGHLNNWSRLIVLDEFEQLRLVARFFLGVDQRQVFEDEALTWIPLPADPIARLQGASPVLKRLADEQLDA